MSDPEYRPEVALYLRSLSSTGIDQQQQELIERLQTMERAGDIAEFEVEVWGERIPHDPQTMVGRSILDRIEAFEAWSDRAGTSLMPIFGTRASGSLVTEDTIECIVPPMCCLVEHDGDTIHHVAPCIADGIALTVADRLNSIERASKRDRTSRLTNV